MHDQPRFIASSTSPVWPERLHALVTRWFEPMMPEDRERVRAEIWVLLVGALEARIRGQATGRPDCDAERCYDLAVEKALDLMRRFAGNEWDPREFAPAQLQRYLNLLARSAVIDYTRSRAGKTRALETSVAEVDPGLRCAAPDDRAADRRQLAAAVAECAGQMTPRARLAWFLREFCDMPSRRVGRHPAVDMTSGAVDMAVSRGRRMLEKCLRTKGYSGRDFGPGVFAACWEALRGEGDDPMGQARESGGK